MTGKQGEKTLINQAMAFPAPRISRLLRLEQKRNNVLYMF
jgi:hypothetical protein